MTAVVVAELAGRTDISTATIGRLAGTGFADLTRSAGNTRAAFRQTLTFDTIPFFFVRTRTSRTTLVRLGKTDMKGPDVVTDFFVCTIVFVCSTGTSAN